MLMTIQEIARSYKEAKNPEKQIKILAELNACSEEQIIVVLKGQKVLPCKNTSEQSKTRKMRPKRTKLNDLLLEGIATLANEIQELQMNLDIYKEKMEKLQSLVEMEEYEE